MKSSLIGTAIVLLFGTGFYLGTHQEEAYEEEQGRAEEAFENWYNQRALPYGLIPKNAFLNAAQYVRESMPDERSVSNILTDTSQWTAMGPDNVGGRVLSLALDPLNPNIVWAGSASGGLWKSTVGGAGTSAWTQVNTGFPTLSVSSIAIFAGNPNLMYIGTGEVGSIYQRAQVGTPGARSSYGMGILKSTDAGVTWSQTALTWNFSDITAVERVIINPLNQNTLFAATTEGTYRSRDAGASWTRVHTVLMAMDVAINPVDTTILYVACGQRNSTPNPGLYKSTDGGTSWTLLAGGLPATNFGRTSLSISPSNPQIVYAGIANASSSATLGLYRTTNGGTNWTSMSTTNYMSGQGWYNNVAAVHPTNPALVYASGLDIYKSTASGASLTIKSHWNFGYDFIVPPGGPEGPPDYAHADHHAIVFHPTNPSIMYFGCDGGIFQSTDGGETFAGRNGGFQTTQFYNGFANSDTDSLIAIGGLQDNGTVKYSGNNTWSKVYGGDGGWCAIDPTNSDILYEEYVYLAISKSIDGGDNWFGITSGLATGSTNANFIAPFAIAPSNPQILYAGALTPYISTNGGTSWTATNGGVSLNGVMLACIGVSYKSPDTVIVGTGSGNIGATPLFQIFVSYNRGTTWTNVTGSLPSRYPTDISFDQNSNQIAYLTYSGYGVPHVFKTTNAGQTWNNISSNLPDIPTQSVVVDSAYPDHIYVGTDLGVFRTLDGGTSWHLFDSGMPQAMVVDLGISKLNRTLRAATFGNGIYERSLTPTVTSSTLSLTMEASWNILSVPLNPSNRTATSVFPTATSPAFRFQNGYTADDTLDVGVGYWMKFDSAQNVPVTGAAIAQDTIDVSAGWNMIGSISSPVPANAIISVPPGLIESELYGFRHNTGYTADTVVTPGRGYWVKTNGPGQVVLLASALAAQSRNSLGTFGSLVFTDTPGHSRTLFLGKKPADGFTANRYVLPPAPPAGVFDARFASGLMVETVEDEASHEFAVSISSAEYPLVVRWEMNSQPLSVTLLIGSTEIPLHGSPVVIPEGSSSIAVRISSGEGIPTEYSLEQNYPNPFNPNTIIGYNLPAGQAGIKESGFVSLTVYDVTGRKVATLVDGKLEPGSYKAEWNATNAASGVYFYQLKAGRYTDTKKMLLLR